MYDLLFAAQAEHLIGVAMALRSIGGNFGRICGNQVVGMVVEQFGVSTACMLVSLLLLSALLLLCCVPSPEKASARGSGGAKAADATQQQQQEGVVSEIAAGLTMAWRDPALMSFLGVTAICNLFYWSHLPILQVLATNLHATPSQAGLLVSASGWGGLFASIVVTWWNPTRTGLIYCCGAAFANAILPAATIDDFWLSFSAIAASGFMAGLFGAVQSALVMAMVPDELRGRALGLLTLAIGAAPFGCVILGELAEWLGANLGLAGYSVCGFAVQLLWLSPCVRPHALLIKRPT